jgi:hypothetical protein
MPTEVLVAWLARQWGCPPTVVLRQPMWAVEAALALAEAEAQVQREEVDRWQRRRP